MHVRTYAFSGCRGQKSSSDPLELESWMVTSHHVGTGNQTALPEEQAQSSLSSLIFIFNYVCEYVCCVYVCV